MTAWQNQPTSPTAMQQMAYDGEGNRVALVVNWGTPTYYLGSLEEISGGITTRYVRTGLHRVADERAHCDRGLH